MSETELSIETEPAVAPPIDLRVAVRRTVWSLLGLFVLLATVGVAFESELQTAAERVEQTLGVPGLALLVFLADAFTLPIPPDLALVVVANSARSSDWLWIVLLLGSVSTLAGVVAYAVGKRLTRVAAIGRIRELVRGKHFAAVRRYGHLGVAAGAVTPIPFSITCYAAGALGLSFWAFCAVCALRIPRFFVYYWVLAYATRLSSLF